MLYISWVGLAIISYSPTLFALLFALSICQRALLGELQWVLSLLSGGGLSTPPPCAYDARALPSLVAVYRGIKGLDC